MNLLINRSYGAYKNITLPTVELMSIRESLINDDDNDDIDDDTVDV